MTLLRLPHRSQWFFDASEKSVLENWVNIRVSESWVLHHHPSLSVHHRVNGGGFNDVLLGEVTEQREGRPQPKELLGREVSEGDLESWAGRWLLVSGGLLRADASGLMGCFYSAYRDSSPIIASSLAIVAALRTPNLFEVPGHIAPRGNYVDWIPPPLSAIPGILKLLPSQALTLIPGEKVEALDRPQIEVPGPSPTVVEDFGDALVRGLVNSERDRFLLPLTGGLDSRTLLAAVQKSGKEYSTFTHVVGGISAGDRSLPPKLSALVDAQHVQLTNGPRDTRLLRAFQLQSYGQCHQCSTFYEFDHYRDLPLGQWTMLSGGCFEVGRCFFWDRLPVDLKGPASEIVERIVAGFRPRVAAPIAPVIREGLLLWVERVKAKPTQIDWRDLFYIEQRLAGWLSTTAQATDANGIPNMFLANSRYLYGLMLSQAPEERRAGSLQRRVISYLAPELLSLPVNPPPSLLETMGKKIRKLGTLVETVAKRRTAA